MKKLMTGVLLIFLWILGIYERDCTAAVMFSVIPVCYILEIGIAILKWQIYKRKADIK